MKKRAVLFIIAAVLYIGSLALPYWMVTMKAPTYPERNLAIRVWAYKYAGDVKEWNIVGRLVGVRVPPPFPKIIFVIFPATVVGLAVLSIAAAFKPRLAKGAAILPWFVLGGLGVWFQYILYRYGHNLDPNRPLRYVEPFTPPIVGVVKVGSIITFHVFHAGAVLFVLAGLLAVLAAREAKREMVGEQQ